MLMDSIILPCFKFCYKASVESSSFAETSKIAKVWLNQRGFISNGADEDFTIFLFDMIMAWMLSCGSSETLNRVSLRKIGTKFSSYQIFKQALEFIARFNFESQPLLLCDGDEVLQTISLTTD